MSNVEPTQPPNDALPKYPETPQAEEKVPPWNLLIEFQRTLALLTPRIFVTPFLIGVNVVAFVLMSISGVHLMQPAGQDLLKWGANFGPATMSGEWWRLLTCTFVHVGIVHLLFNMWVLATAGPLVERMVGNVGFLLLYLASGLVGSAASLLWNPMLISAGASGALFGVYGALLGMLLRQHGAIPAEALVQLRNSGLLFLGYNLVFGMTQPNIDSAAHIGGLVAGFLWGLVLNQPLVPSARAGRPLRNILVAGLGAVLVLASIIVVNARHQEVSQVQAELDRFVRVEKKALDAINSAVTKAQRQELTDAAFADVIERDVLPEWRASRERLASLTKVPPTVHQHVSMVLEYMVQRQEGWEIFAEALREGNEEKAKRAGAKQQLAEATAKRITEKGRK